MTAELKKNIWTGVKEYGIMSLGLLCYAVGWVIFLLPNNLVGGGVSGISAIIQYATGGAIPMGWSYLVINFVLLIIGIAVLGKGFGWKTVYAIAYTSILLNLIPGYIPDTFIKAFSTANGPLLCTILGGVLSGVGIGASISQGGSSGGTDIVALIIAKYKNISPGKLILLMDVVIICSSLFVPSIKADGTQVDMISKLANAAYGLILITVNSYTIDIYLSGTKQSVQVFIFSKKYGEIADALAYDLKRGVTVFHSMGWFSKQESNVLMVVARKTDLTMLLRYIKSIDSDAFLSISNVMGVFGQGFDEYKGKRLQSKGTPQPVPASESSPEPASNAESGSQPESKPDSPAQA